MNATLDSKTDFVDVYSCVGYGSWLRIKDFEIKRLIWIIRVGPKCNHKCPYKRKAKGDLTTVDVMTETRGWSNVSKGCKPRNVVRKGQEMDSLQKPPEGMQPCQYLDFRLLICKRINLCCFKPLSLWWFVTAGTGNQHRYSDYNETRLHAKQHQSQVTPDGRKQPQRPKEQAGAPPTRVTEESSISKSFGRSFSIWTRPLPSNISIGWAVTWRVGRNCCIWSL